MRCKSRDILKTPDLTYPTLGDPTEAHRLETKETTKEERLSVKDKAVVDKGKGRERKWAQWGARGFREFWAQALSSVEQQDKLFNQPAASP